MTYKEKIAATWISAGGLITKITAAKILGVNPSVLSRRKDIRKYEIENDEFVSFQEIMARTDIKSRKKKDESNTDT